MKVGNLVRRKPNPITNQPAILGLVTETHNFVNAIRVAFIDPAFEDPYHAQQWRKPNNFEIVS